MCAGCIISDVVKKKSNNLFYDWILTLILYIILHSSIENNYMKLKVLKQNIIVYYTKNNYVLKAVSNIIKNTIFSFIIHYYI